MSVFDYDEHTNFDEHDGTLMDGCPACEAIAKFPCQWCGYGAMFYSHNLLAHSENGDPICQEGGFGENNFTEKMLVEPWRDWYTVYDTGVLV